MPSSDLQRLSSVIHRERERAGLSLRQLAARSGLGASTLQRIEKNEIAHPDVHTLQAIARALAVDVEDFYAAVGYLDWEDLPALRVYLRAKYGIAGDEANRIEGYVQALRDAPARPQQQPPEEDPTDDHQRGNTNP